MPSALPAGDPVPADGSLPAEALSELGERPFGVYLHVPFCSVRCGYCDFNTYTALELGGPSAPVSQATYAEVAAGEVRLARQVLGDAVGPVETVFVGGGTPTLLPPDDLVGLLRLVDQELGLAADVEVTTEANPDSVDARGAGPVAGGRFHAGVVRHAVGGAARAGHAGSHARPGAGAAGRRLGSGRRLRRGQPRPDLRDAGGVARRLGDQPRRRAGLRAGPRVGVRPHRRAGHGAGPRGRPGRDRGARRRRHGRQVPPRRRTPHRRRTRAGTSCPTGRAGRRAGAGTTSSTGPAPTGGGSVPARTATSAGCGGGTCATPRRTPPAWPPARARGTRASCSTTRPVGSSGCCWRPGWSGVSPPTCSTARGAPRWTPSPPRVSWSSRTTGWS